MVCKITCVILWVVCDIRHIILLMVCVYDVCAILQGCVISCVVCYIRQVILWCVISDVVRVLGGERIWWTWSREQMARGSTVAEVDKCVTTVGKRTTREAPIEGSLNK